MIKEKIDFFWALKAANISQDYISEERFIILEELGLKRKRNSYQMFDFKQFDIKKAISNP